jgi:hypothetical protein
LGIKHCYVQGRPKNNKSGLDSSPSTLPILHILVRKSPELRIRNLPLLSALVRWIILACLRILGNVFEELQNVNQQNAIQRRIAMADFLSDLASKAGLDGEQTHQGLGALLTLLKSRLSPDAYARLKSAIPSSDDMLASAQDKIQWSGAGTLEGVKNVAGRIFGGQDPAAALESHISNVGVSADQLKSMLPKLHDMLAKKCPRMFWRKSESTCRGSAPRKRSPFRRKRRRLLVFAIDDGNGGTQLTPVSTSSLSNRSMHGGKGKKHQAGYQREQPKEDKSGAGQ